MSGPDTSGSPVFSYRRLLLLGFGFMGVQSLWAIYNAYVPMFLQAGRADYAAAHPGVPGFGLSAPMTAFVMTLDNLAALVILPYIGALSDRVSTRWGRRKPFIAAAAPFAAIAFAAVPFTLGASLSWFMLSIVVTLLAMDVLRTPVVSLMPDTTPSEHRSQANGVINLMGGLGSVAALGAGGTLFAVSFHAPFLFAAGAMSLGIGTILLFVREPAAAAGPEDAPTGSLLGALGEVVRDPDRSALRILLATFFWSLGQSSIDVFLTSFAVDELDADPGAAGFTVGFLSLSVLFFSVPAGLIGARFGRRRTVLVAISVLGSLLLACLGVESIGLLRVLLIGMGMAWTTMVVQALPMVVDCAPASRLGTYTGLYYLATQTASVIGPVAAGQLVEELGNQYRVIFAWAAAMLALAFAAMWGVRGGEARTAAAAR